MPQQAANNLTKTRLLVMLLGAYMIPRKEMGMLEILSIFPWYVWLGIVAGGVLYAMYESATIESKYQVLEFRADTGPRSITTKQSLDAAKRAAHFNGKYATNIQVDEYRVVRNKRVYCRVELDWTITPDRARIEVTDYGEEGIPLDDVVND